MPMFDWNYISTLMLGDDYIFILAELYKYIFNNKFELNQSKKKQNSYFD